MGVVTYSDSLDIAAVDAQTYRLTVEEHERAITNLVANMTKEGKRSELIAYWERLMRKSLDKKRGNT